MELLTTLNMVSEAPEANRLIDYWCKKDSMDTPVDSYDASLRSGLDKMLACG